MKTKKCILFLFIFLSVCFFSPEKSFAFSSKEKISDIISPEEGMILNKVHQLLIKKDTSICSFDFTYKKVAFYTGSGAGARSHKLKYIHLYKCVKEEHPNSIPWTKIYLFDEEEKKKADGYDAVIVFGSVKQFPSKKRLIRRLHILSLFK